MLKQILQTPPETGAIDGYTSELSRVLRPHLPGERADEIINEAQSHLLDQADAIAKAENLPLEKAEARAVADFTPAVAFAREMAQSAYETGQSKVWRTLVKTVAAMAFLGMFALLVVLDPFTFPLTIGAAIAPLLVTPCALLLTFCFCAFQARRAQTRLFVVGGAVVTLFTFFCTGVFYFDAAPAHQTWTHSSPFVQSTIHFNSVNRTKRQWRQNDASNVMWLQTGLQAFASENPFIPAKLKGGYDTGYIVPQRWGSDTSFIFDARETVPTLAEARARWQTDGPRWLAETRASADEHKHYYGPLGAALQQTGFAAHAVPWYAVAMGILSGYLSLCDWLFAQMGRAAFVRRRSKRTKRT